MLNLSSYRFGSKGKQSTMFTFITPASVYYMRIQYISIAADDMGCKISAKMEIKSKGSSLCNPLAGFSLIGCMKLEYGQKGNQPQHYVLQYNCNPLFGNVVVPGSIKPKNNPH